MAETAIRFRDDPWPRLPWLVPAAIVLTLISQIGFLSLLRQPATQSAVPRPVDVQIVELPVTVTPPAPPPTPPAPPARRPAVPPKPRAEPPPTPTPPQPEARVELPRDPTPPAAEEPMAQAPATAATVPVRPAPAASGTVVGPPTQPPVAALPPTPAPPAAPSAPARITQPARPRGGYQVRPAYPAAARRAGVEGTTVLRVHVRVDGTIDDVQVSRSAGDAALDEAAAAAVTRWRFEPARSGAEAVAVWVLIPVEFRLQNEN